MAPLTGGDESGPRRTFRRDLLATYRRQPHGIVWQPRIEHWYNTRKHEGTLPPRYRDMDILEVYDDIGASPRGYNQFNPTIKVDLPEDVEATTERYPEATVVTTKTPVGTLREVTKVTGLSRLLEEFPIKSPRDWPAMAYILKHRRVRFDAELYRQQDALVGERTLPIIYMPRVSIQRLYVQYMGFERTIFALRDYPKEMEQIVRDIEESDEPVYDVVCASPYHVVNFGDNVHCETLPPPLFERFILPYYRRRTAQLQRAGIACHPHWDGYVRQLLPYLQRCGFDGYEALTPTPQGDVTMEEIKEALGDLILVDGIPCVMFLDNIPNAELAAYTRRVIDLFAPNLVLGISDELSPVGDIEKVRLVSEVVAEYNAHVLGL